MVLLAIWCFIVGYCNFHLFHSDPSAAVTTTAASGAISLLKLLLLLLLVLLVIAILPIYCCFKVISAAVVAVALL